MAQPHKNSLIGTNQAQIFGFFFGKNNKIFTKIVEKTKKCKILIFPKKKFTILKKNSSASWGCRPPNLHSEPQPGLSGVKSWKHYTIHSNFACFETQWAFTLWNCLNWFKFYDLLTEWLQSQKLKIRYLNFLYGRFISEGFSYIPAEI